MGGETTSDYDMPYCNIFMIHFHSLSLCKLAFMNLYASAPLYFGGELLVPNGSALGNIM